MKTLIDSVVQVAIRAGEAILQVYGTEFGSTEKEDRSPLTDADLASNAVIVPALADLLPGVPILSEESRAVPYSERASWSRFWLVDPLDGTKEFIKRNGEFTVNIALVEDGVPIAGVVHAPVLGRTYLGIAGEDAWEEEGGRRTPIQVVPTGDPLLVVASRSHNTPETQAFLDALAVEHSLELTSIGSSLKLCLVASGRAHIYPRFAPTMEWDTASAHAVVRAAGGFVSDRRGNELRYNKEDLLNPHFLVSGSDPAGWLRFDNQTD